MHEISLAESLVEQLEAVVVEEGAKGVDSIELELGAMSGVEQDQFEFAFPIVAKGTKLEGAVLHFHLVPVSIKCDNCGKISSPDKILIICEACNATNVNIVAGREFRVKSMEVTDV